MACDSTCPRSAGAGWCLNIPCHKFEQHLQLILNSATEAKHVHIEVPASSIMEPRGAFRSLRDSANIFMPSSGKNRFIGMQAGRSPHDFGGCAASGAAYGQRWRLGRRRGPSLTHATYARHGAIARM